MSKFGEVRPSRARRRADAERSAAAVLDAAVRVLNERPAATMGEIAGAAGVTRQTAYAHFPSREALLRAVIDRATQEALEAMDAADLEQGPAAEALMRLLEAGWQTFERYPLLLHPLEIPASGEESYDLHRPIFDRLERLVLRGQATGEFDDRLPATWLLAATVALGHAAGQEIGAGRMSAEAATAAFRRSVLCLFGADRHA